MNCFPFVALWFPNLSRLISRSIPLQDFTHVHKFIGHEHKVMAVVYADEEQPLCISGDSGGGIFIWGISNPFGQEPIKKLYEQKDWRYSGIHALAISGSGYLYTGSGDKSIKAWSLKVIDYFNNHSDYEVI